MPGLAHMELVRSPHAARRDRWPSTRPRRWPSPACWPSSATSMPPTCATPPRGTRRSPTTRSTPCCSTGWSASPASAWPRWWPRRRRGRRAGGRSWWTVQYRVAACRVRPRGGHGRRGAAGARRQDAGGRDRRPAAQRRRRGPRRTSATWRPAWPARTRWSSQSFSIHRVQHAHLETHAAVGWLEDGGRLVVRTSTQTPFLTRDALCRLFGLPAGPGAGARRPGRRRFRRQAGDADRGRRRPGRAAAAPAGAAGVHPRGAVRRRDHPPPDADHRPGRRRGGRHADRAGRPDGGQHRRLRQPRRRGAVPQLRRVGQPVPVPEQEGRRLVGLHQHRPGRGASAATGCPSRPSRSSPRWTSWPASWTSTRSSSAAAT